MKKSYKEFIIEKSYLKNRIETFNSNIETKGIPDSLKEISINLSNELIEVPSIKKINFLGYNFYFNIRYGTCHSFVRYGKITYCDDSTHDLKNQTVELLYYNDI